MKRKKEKTYICVVCSKKKKGKKASKCCGKNMIAKEKATWNAQDNKNISEIAWAFTFNISMIQLFLT